MQISKQQAERRKLDVLYQIVLHQQGNESERRKEQLV
jgi:hypothetical protein